MWHQFFKRVLKEGLIAQLLKCIWKWLNQHADSLQTIASIGLVFASIWLVFENHSATRKILHQTKMLNSAKMIMNLKEEYYSKSMLKERRKISSLLLAQGDLEINRFEVLNFLDRVGLMVDDNVLDFDMVRNDRSWDIECYYQALKGHGDHLVKDYLAIYRSSVSDPEMYQHFENLALELLNKDKSPPEPQDVREFLTSELTETE